MTDDRLGMAAGKWLRDIDSPASNPDASVQQTMTQVRQTRQARRWWPPIFRKAGDTPLTADQTTDYQPTLIPATNGHTPTVLGRTQSMFSPAKAITAGALVFAIGGVLLIAQPFDQQGGSLPGAEIGAAPPTPVSFTSTYAWSHQPTVGQVETLGNDVQVTTAKAWQFRNIEATDPRFAGTMTQTETAVQYPGEVIISMGAYRIETDEGAWQEVPASSFNLAANTGTENPLEAGSTIWQTYVGEGAYEGNWAIVRQTWRPDGDNALVDILLDGYVVEGDPLEAPEPWSAE